MIVKHKYNKYKVMMNFNKEIMIQKCHSSNKIMPTILILNFRMIIYYNIKNIYNQMNNRILTNIKIEILKKMEKYVNYM